MPIINKGRLRLSDVSLRQAGNDWPTAQVISTSDVVENSANLYFTNARVIAALSALTTANISEVSSNLYFSNTRVFDAVTIGTIQGSLSVTGNLVANGLIIRNIAVSDSVLTGSTSANNVVADAITANIWNRLYSSNVIELNNLFYTNSRVISAVVPLLTTANVIETSANLYFTNTRARAAFTAGRGIILMSDGTIKSTIGTETFNTGIDGGRSYAITTSMNGITFTSSNAGDRLILRSLHVTNVTDNPAYISSNVLYAGGNTAYLGNLIPVPVGSIVEFMDRPQIIQPNDTINLQAFNQNQTPANNILQAYFTYETVVNDTTYVGTGHTLATSNANILITTADQSDTVFESIKFVNLKPYSIGVKTFFGDPNGIPRSYLAYNLQVPPNSSVEVLQSPKLLKFLDTLYVSYANASNGDAIAVFPSYRRTAVTTPYASTSSAVAQGSIQAAFNTTIIDGSTLYYTLE